MITSLQLLTIKNFPPHHMNTSPSTTRISLLSASHQNPRSENPHSLSTSTTRITKPSQQHYICTSPEMSAYRTTEQSLSQETSTSIIPSGILKATSYRNLRLRRLLTQ